MSEFVIEEGSPMQKALKLLARRGWSMKANDCEVSHRDDPANPENIIMTVDWEVRFLRYGMPQSQKAWNAALKQAFDEIGEEFERKDH